MRSQIQEILRTHHYESERFLNVFGIMDVLTERGFLPENISYGEVADAQEAIEQVLDSIEWTRELPERFRPAFSSGHVSGLQPGDLKTLKALRRKYNRNNADVIKETRPGYIQAGFLGDHVRQPPSFRDIMREHLEIGGDIEELRLQFENDMECIAYERQHSL